MRAHRRRLEWLHSPRMKIQVKQDDIILFTFFTSKDEKKEDGRMDDRQTTIPLLNAHEDTN